MIYSLIREIMNVTLCRYRITCMSHISHSWHQLWCMGGLHGMKEAEF